MNYFIFSYQETSPFSPRNYFVVEKRESSDINMVQSNSQLDVLIDSCIKKFPKFKEAYVEPDEHILKYVRKEYSLDENSKIINSVPKKKVLEFLNKN